MTLLNAVAPADLRPLDRVLLNGSFWTLIDARRARHNSHTAWRLKLDHDGDVIDIFRDDQARLCVERHEP